MALTYPFGRSAAVLMVLISTLCLAPGARAQSRPDGNNTAAKSPEGSPAAPSTARQNAPASNAFPMGESQAAADAASKRTANQRKESDSGQNAAGARGNSQSSGADGASAPQSSPAKDNPFPESQSRAAAKSAQGTGTRAASPAPGAPSSAGSYSSSDAHLPPPDVGDGKSRRGERLDSFTRDQTQDGRIEGDLHAADLYMKNGNYRGAYLRYQDALKYDPQNDTSLYGSAEAMCKQNLTQEALARFKAYAKDHPQGKYALKAEKMLAHPNKCANNF